MNLIVCVDNAGGIAFNHRRQSRDSAVINRICSLAEQSRLLVHPYSLPFFADKKWVCGSENYLEEAGAGEYCFVERESLAKYIGKIEKLIVFLWNRDYPSDTKLGIELTGLTPVFTEDFVGSSHEKITEAIYVL